jgi:hypothetical protein
MENCAFASGADKSEIRFPEQSIREQQFSTAPISARPNVSQLPTLAALVVDLQNSKYILRYLDGIGTSRIEQR